MRVLELEGDDPRGWGRAHGEAFAPLIRELVSIRIELCVELGAYTRPTEVLAAAERHLPVLAARCPALAAELTGIAEGAGLDEASVVVLNHYTDLRDLDPEETRVAAGPGEADDDCSAVYARTDRGPVLGQTWDMHGSAEPYVLMIKVPARGAVPAAWLFTITGCLGMTGMNQAGVGITINNLKSLDARVGLVWPALVRRVLHERTANAAAAVVTESPLGSGHHYLVADANGATGVETSGTRKRVVYDGVAPSYVHTNHCLSADVAEVSTVAASSTTRERWDALTHSLSERALAGPEDLWSRLGSHEGYPRSVCTHLATIASPHAMRTCGGLVMDLTARHVLAAQGCLHRARPQRFDFGSTP